MVWRKERWHLQPLVAVKGNTGIFRKNFSALQSFAGLYRSVKKARSATKTGRPNSPVFSTTNPLTSRVPDLFRKRSPHENRCRSFNYSRITGVTGCRRRSTCRHPASMANSRQSRAQCDRRHQHHQSYHSFPVRDVTYSINVKVEISDTSLPGPKGEMAAGPRSIGFSADPHSLVILVIAIVAVAGGMWYMVKRKPDE